MSSSDVIPTFISFVILLVSGLVGAGFVWGYYRFRIGGYQKIAAEILHRAELDAETLKKTTELGLKQVEMDQRRVLDEMARNEQRKLERSEEQFKAREEKLEERIALISKRLAELDQREEALDSHRAKLEEERNKAAVKRQELVVELEKVSGLSQAEARDLLLQRLEVQMRSDSAHLIRRMHAEAEEEADQEAVRIIATSINRLASACTSDVTVSTISLPNDEVKGRIIGREGRNIRALENATGVNFIIDDTPNAVVISGFDPVRKQIAKVALNELVLDGRIHPKSIEEAVERATDQVSKEIKRAGEDAALRAGAIDLHPELIRLLGRLHFRYSYGQNILAHSVEVSTLLGMMAAELGLDQQLAKRIGLLHDIGKAVTHEVDGSHAIIGYELAKKCGESSEVANGIGCHHGEMAPITLEGSLCSAADAISASRPGARIEAVEQYVRRLRRLEEIAMGYSGVIKAYALQAGREVRVLVQPDVVTDDELVGLAREIAHRIEKELTYPGKIKVTILRESQATEYAI
jgi:ribonucrease Y